MEALYARGPEGAQLVNISGVGSMGFTRLAINGLNAAGMQPMADEDRTWMCNGEIYNWRALAEEYGITTRSGSDCEILGELYEKFYECGMSLGSLFQALDGVFAIVLVDQARQQVIIARDPYGVRPLFVTRDGCYAVASEMKALTPLTDNPDMPLEVFPPGHYQVIDYGDNTSYIREPVAYHTIPFLKNPLFVPDRVELALMAVRQSLTAAVQKRMMTERPVAALLSGGLDSSLIAALVAKELRAAGAPPLKTFSIGMKGSSDLLYAQKVAFWIGSDHTEIMLTADDFFNAVPEVIRAIESYDTTTVRASVGNWLVAKAVAKTDCKVVFNGDGSDEVWGSYLYFYNAPSPHAFEEESRRLLTDIHLFDVLRSDRSVSSHGLEPRTPYLDKEFVGVAQSVSTLLRRPVQHTRCEKWLMRKAFDDGELLPSEVLWRRKEAFSDGVSGTEKSWYKIAQEKSLAAVGPRWREEAVKDGLDCPTTAEKYYYRKCFIEYFGAQNRYTTVPYLWMPRWSPGSKDPSARTLGVYTSAT